MLPSERASKVVKERGKTYGHPRGNYARQAKFIEAVLDGKLTAEVTPEEAVAIMLCLKISRELTSPFEDNRTDMAGYANVWEMVQDEEEPDES